MNLTEGPLFKQTVAFTVPILLSGLLQLCFNAADMIVVGRFASAQSLAAVGSTGSLCNLIVTIFMGLSVGANVIVANHFGAKDRKGVSRAAHTAVTVSLFGGLLMMAIGLFAAKPMLMLMQVPEESVLPKACLYMWIYCCGIPANLLYNFGSAILRAVGDTKSPLRYLTLAGIVNVILNLLFVIAFHLDVAGVAIATVASHIISAVLIMRNLLRSREACRISYRLLRIDTAILKNIVRIGLPAGIQSSLFSIANMTIQSGVNELGDFVMAGNTAASNIEGFIYVATAAYYQAVTTFAGQNYGAGNYRRIVSSFLYCTLSAVAINIFCAVIVMVSAPQLVAIYNDDPAVIAAGVSRLTVLAFTYIACSVMDNITGALRGLGHSIRPAIVTLGGACLLRILWVVIAFPYHRTLPFLVLCFPLSWIVVSAINGASLYGILKEKCSTP